MSTDKVKVAVRVRPFNRREVELKTKCVIEMKATQTILHHYDTKSEGEGRKQPKTFAFDNCFFSFDPAHPTFASQQDVFQALGEDILDNAFKGYNACIFAYGQTGSGKSFSMMGSPGNEGVIPRLCDALFDRIAKNEDQNLVYKVEVSYMEIYNEKVHDLLNPKGTKQNLRVREHNILGPYVDGLSILAVTSFEDIDNLMQEGNKSRTVAATNMNNESSRSHAVFNIILTCSETDSVSGVTGEKASKMSLVDLAGSERAVKTGAVGDRLKEGSNINKSLTTLGLVISKLADQSSGRGAKDKFVPYRDSVLTWLLKDNLGGNSKTVMIATISPAGDNYEETLSTLRYADRAKRIVNHAVVNEDPNARIIRELRAEVEALKEQLKKSAQQEDTKERLEESEKLMNEMSQTWEEKVTKTKNIHQERQQALEKMGISVQASGIKVENSKYYLVNLNADPSLNELLVYYLKEVKTLIGRPCAPVEQDIQLNGLGILPEHCIIEMDNNVLHLTPMEGARTCVNGSVITSRTQIRHGDRVLWGNNHFFRVNCPKSVTSPSCTEEITRPIDYEFAREELMLKEMGNDPIQSAMQALERQHEEDKQGALEEQRLMYEKQLRMLKNQMSPTTPYPPYGVFDPLGFRTPTGFPPSSSIQSKVDSWAEDRDELFRRSLAILREDVVKANSFVREANFLAEEMQKRTEFHVTLQIPAANLSPNRKKSAFVSEPAILVKRENKGSQVWPMEKLENKLIDMREYYEEFKDKQLPVTNHKCLDPFFESQENHNLIGVSNVFLEVLFHDVKLDYHVPIINQQGEVAGRLHVEICRIAGNVQDRMNETSSDSSSDSRRGSNNDVSDIDGGAAQIVCQVHIKSATGLPPSLSNFVFCQYSFWGHDEKVVVAPIVNPEYPATRKGKERMTFKFDDVKEFTVNMTEDFIEHCSEGALSIEVWGHKSTGFGSSKSSWEVDTQVHHSKSLSDRWSELIRKIQLWVEIHELNEQGEYSPVEILTKPDNLTGGTYQLRQGQQRRVVVKVKPVLNSGTLPIIVESIATIAVGSVCARSKLQRGLDSYQEEDLTTLRKKWSEALLKRKEYLDEHIKSLMHKQDKSDQDTEREKSLIDQWVCLTEERNAVLVPAADSKVPGAPSDWFPMPGMEKHIPVLFLDLNADDLTTPNVGDGSEPAGANSILPKEHEETLFNLPIIYFFEKDVGAVSSWDSSIHDSINLNRVTLPNERVYLILKTTVRLSHPATMELVLRKRLAINVYKKQSLTNMIKKRIVRTDGPTACGVTYEVVSNIPKASEDVEDRETLALMAASGEDMGTADGETYIEKYIRGVSAVESILALDKLRQEVAIKELLTAQGRPLRKTASVPNISHGFSWADISSSSCNLNLLDDSLRADSVTDLPSAFSCENFDKIRRRSNPALPDVSTPSKEGSSKPFGLTCISPQLSKLVKPMKTLVEEQYDKESQPTVQMESKSLLIEDVEEEEEEEDVEFADFQSYQSQCAKNEAVESLEKVQVNVLNNNNLNGPVQPAVGLANDNENQTKTPSMSSSGYSSHALSSNTLSSEDSLSVRSISVDDATPDDGANVTKICHSVVTESLTLKTVETSKSSSIEETSYVSKPNAQPQPQVTTESLIEFVTFEGNQKESQVESSVNDLISIDMSLPALHISEDDLRDDGNNGRTEQFDQLQANTTGQHNLLVESDSLEEMSVDNDENTSGSESSDDFELSPEQLSSLASWIVVDESVTTRPGNKTGVIAYIGRTAFAKGIWIGVELDTPTGKNDGSVNEVRYFTCKPRFGVFVRPDKLALDKRGRLLRDKSTLNKSTSQGLNTSGLQKGKTAKSNKRNASSEQLNKVRKSLSANDPVRK